jgi:hypothetical protein
VGKGFDSFAHALGESDFQDILDVLHKMYAEILRHIGLDVLQVLAALQHTLAFASCIVMVLTDDAWVEDAGSGGHGIDGGIDTFSTMERSKAMVASRWVKVATGAGSE